jgi:hypothetical protein
MTWFRTGIWKLKGLRCRVEGGIYPLCLAENAIHLILTCAEIHIWREIFEREVIEFK